MADPVQQLICAAQFCREPDDQVIYTPGIDARMSLTAGDLRALSIILQEHGARVTELLEANNREVEKRRKAEAERDQLRRQLAALDIESAITGILNSVMELPDRTSPEDWPEACLVTGEELDGILRQHLIEYPAEMLPLPTPIPSDTADTAVAWLVPRHPTNTMMEAGLYHCSADMKWEDLFTAFHAMVDAAPTRQPSDTGELKLGDRIKYRPGGKYSEWAEGGPYYYAGVTARVNPKGPNLWVSESWPVECNGHITDGFDPDEWEKDRSPKQVSP